MRANADFLGVAAVTPDTDSLEWSRQRSHSDLSLDAVSPSVCGRIWQKKRIVTALEKLLREDRFGVFKQVQLLSFKKIF